MGAPIATTTTLVLCPFCDEVITRTEWPVLEAKRIEEACRGHLLREHSIRWRLSPKYRRAMRGGS